VINGFYAVLLRIKRWRKEMDKRYLFLLVLTFFVSGSLYSSNQTRCFKADVGVGSRRHNEIHCHINQEDIRKIFNEKGIRKVHKIISIKKGVNKRFECKLLKNKKEVSCAVFKSSRLQLVFKVKKGGIHPSGIDLAFDANSETTGKKDYKQFFVAGTNLIEENNEKFFVQQRFKKIPFKDKDQISKLFGVYLLPENIEQAKRKEIKFYQLFLVKTKGWPRWAYQ